MGIGDHFCSVTRSWPYSHDVSNCVCDVREPTPCIDGDSVLKGRHRDLCVGELSAESARFDGPPILAVEAMPVSRSPRIPSRCPSALPAPR
jgi:hypothetical protein